VQTLARLCYKQETQQLKAFKRKGIGLVTREANSLYLLNKQKKGTNSVKKSLLNYNCKIVNEELNAPQRENNLELRS
jgi:hypothetical protein